MKKGLFTVLFAIFMIMCGGLTAKAETIAKAPENQMYVVKDGARYYESSAKGGSGRSAVVGKENIYTGSPCWAMLDGYSYLDDSGEPILNDYIPEEYDIDIPKAPEGAVHLMVHFKTPVCGRNGWVSYQDVEPVDEKELTATLDEQPTAEALPEEVVEEIGDALNQAEESNEKTVVAIDFSGSMSDNQAEVIRQLETIEVGENTTIIVWAEWTEEMTPQEVVEENFYVGGGTHLMKALNKVGEKKPDNLILISDLEAYEDELLVPCDTVKKVTIYDPDDTEDDSDIMEYIQNVWNEATITRTKIAE